MDKALMIIDPSHCCCFLHNWVVTADKNYIDNIQTIIEIENNSGYNLIRTISLSGIVDSQSSSGLGKGTYAFYLLFRWIDSTNLRLDRSILELQKNIINDGFKCPVLGCNIMHNSSIDDMEPRQICRKHGIFFTITKEYYEYIDSINALIWKDSKDIQSYELVSNLAMGQGLNIEALIGSEKKLYDLTWNIFWYLISRGDIFTFIKNIVQLSVNVDKFRKSDKYIWLINPDDGSIIKSMPQLFKLAHWSEIPGLTLTSTSTGSILNIVFEMDIEDITPCDMSPYVSYDQWSTLFNAEPDVIINAIGEKYVRMLINCDIARIGSDCVWPYIIFVTKQSIPGDVIDKIIEYTYNSFWSNPPFINLTYLDIANDSADNIIGRLIVQKTLGYDKQGDLITLI